MWGCVGNGVGKDVADAFEIRTGIDDAFEIRAGTNDAFEIRTGIDDAFETIAEDVTPLIVDGIITLITDEAIPSTTPDE